MRLSQVVMGWLCTLGTIAVSVAQGPPPSPVHVAPVVVETVGERRMVTGELRSLRIADVAAQEQGVVVEMAIEVGTRVEAGQLLARIDADRLELEHTRTKAERDAAESQVDAERALAERWAEEVEALAGAALQGASNARERREALAESRQADARLERAERDLLVYDARLALLERRLEDMRIVAPFAGAVTRKIAERGEWLGEGDSVCELVQTDVVQVVLDAPQRYLPALTGLGSNGERESGGLATGSIIVEADALSEPIEVRRVRLVPQVDQRARTFRIVAEADNRNGALAAGQSVIGWVPTGVQAAHTIVPTDAVFRNEMGTIVYVARQMGDGPHQAMPTTVEVLFELPGRVVVRSDSLREGDLVVTEGKERLYPTAPVRPLVDGSAQKPGEGPGGGSSGETGAPGDGGAD